MMKDFFKTLLIFLGAASAFLIGLYLGGESVKSKISDFQEDLEEKK